jgi:hypothetical protein
VVVPWVFGIGQVGSDVIAPAHVTKLRLLQKACQQAERQRVTTKRLRRLFTTIDHTQKGPGFQIGR